MKNLLSQLRGRGATVQLSPTGGMILKVAPSDLIPFVHEQKAEILQTLRLERIDGEMYEHSKLRFDLDRLGEMVSSYRIAGIAMPQCLELMELLWEIERVACDNSLDEGLESLTLNGERILEFTSYIESERRAMLTGERLVYAVKTVFAPQKRINVSALA